jgi:hypothetical protein
MLLKIQLITLAFPQLLGGPCSTAVVSGFPAAS